MIIELSNFKVSYTVKKVSKMYQSLILCITKRYITTFNAIIIHQIVIKIDHIDSKLLALL